ncbi:MAG TPA: ATP-binding protein [Thermoleophilaceae bacterium]|jgi:hypothetical protein
MAAEALTNGGFVVRFEEVEASAGQYERLRRFLAPFFAPAGGGAVPDLTVRFHPAEEFARAVDARLGERVAIRTSTDARFDLWVDAGRDPGGRLAGFDRSRRTGYRIAAASHAVDFFASGDSFFHLMELVRYYGLVVEEARGSVVLQAAAIAEGCERAVAICGPKGAGKTTTMLRRVLADDGVRCLSGDRVLLRLDSGGRPLVRGWPDYPHVGLGTLREAPELARRCGVDVEAELSAGREPSDKLVLDPDPYYAGLLPPDGGPLPLAAVLVPDVRAGEDGTRPLPAGDRRARLDGVVERASEFVTGTWHGMRPPERPRPDGAERALAALCELPWTEVRSRPR